jgi:hypothetical protein
MRPLSGKRSSWLSCNFLPWIRDYCFLPVDANALPFFSALFLIGQFEASAVGSGETIFQHCFIAHSLPDHQRIE